MSDNVSRSDIDSLLTDMAFGMMPNTERRFGTVTNEDVDTFLNEQKNVNTKKKTARDVRVFMEYLALNGD